MSIFDKLKSAVGLGSTPTTTGPGRKLGGGAKTDEPKPQSYEYSVTFCDSSIGLQLEAAPGAISSPIVTKVLYRLTSCFAC